MLEKVEVADGEKSDLVIHDADGRPTTYHALAAEEILEGIVGDEAANAFNAVMALGMLRTLYHVTGEPEIWVRYRELISKRRYLDLLETSLADLVYFREITNYSLVNMAFIAVYGLLRYENDPLIASRVRNVLETQMYDAGVDRDARGLRMSFYDFIFAAFRTDGIDGIGGEALADGLATLDGFAAPPYWDTTTTNCDQAEIDALECELIDGSVVRLSKRRGYGGDRVVAVEPLAIEVRPPSDFMWRSDPHAVNGGGHDRLNFGGDFHAAYWMGRFLQASASGADNISPIARGEPAVIPSEGCGCAAAGAHREASSGAIGCLIALALVIAARRRSPR